MSISDRELVVGDVTVPRLWYGTAWKEEATEGLVAAALISGFRAIDTANQRKHYFEEGVGKAIAAAIARGVVTRDALFVQSKFTFRDGQDHRLPYDARAPIAQQVAQSFASSLAHLGLERLDSLVLHGPSQRESLGAADHEAWRAMEALATDGRVGFLGVSNVTARQLAELIAFAQVRPTFVQNRCYAERGWDHAVRAAGAKHGVTYQGFSLLTANRHVVGSPQVAAIAARHQVTPAQVVLRFATQVGMIGLTGTRDLAHMRDDLAMYAFKLRPDEVATIQAL